AFCYSCLGILGKKALAEDVPLLSILSTRFTLGALIYWGWVLLRADLRRSVKGLAAPRARALFAWGLFGFAGQSVIFFAALQRISASLSEVLLYTCPAFLALILWVTTGRRPTGTQGGAIVLALSGTWLCAGPIAGATDSLGVALAVLAGFWYALFLLRLHRITPGLPSALSGALIISGAAVAFDLATLLLGGYHVPATPAAWGAILGMVLTATVFGFVLFVVGLKRVGAQTASILSTFEPLGTLMLARLLLGERLTPPQWAGAALIIGASFVLAATEPEGMESAAGAGAAAHD
ncbi:MAG TPA: EamA family transporter, partial [Candidatus Polarisedimenticolia bacterium]|nr:EamA family transporter [Candidatus Polarisedimenticolia bacterium]